MTDNDLIKGLRELAKAFKKDKTIAGTFARTILDITKPVKEKKTPSQGNPVDPTLEYQELLSSIWLYVDWKYVTKQLTTEEKELWANAIDETQNPEDTIRVHRWWR